MALMLEANPSLTPRLVKALLMRTAQRLRYYETSVMTGQMSSFERAITEGAGELNTSAAVSIAKAIRQDANKAKPGENLHLPLHGGGANIRASVTAMPETQRPNLRWYTVRSLDPEC